MNDFLSATAKLNRDVNVKGIVIGIMDRLSNFAARDAKEEDVDKLKEKETDAITQLLEDLKLETEKAEAERQAKKDAEAEEAAPKDTNAPEGEAEPTPSNGNVPDTAEAANEDSEGLPDGTKTPDKSILSKVKLFEIFYDQVVKLVNVCWIAHTFSLFRKAYTI